MAACFPEVPQNQAHPWVSHAHTASKKRPSFLVVLLWRRAFVPLDQWRLPFWRDVTRKKSDLRQMPADTLPCPFAKLANTSMHWDVQCKIDDPRPQKRLIGVQLSSLHPCVNIAKRRAVVACRLLQTLGVKQARKNCRKKRPVETAESFGCSYLTWIHLNHWTKVRGSVTIWYYML